MEIKVIETIKAFKQPDLKRFNIPKKKLWYL